METLVPDTSVLVDGRITALVRDEHPGARVLVPLAALAELEAQANRGLETGFAGLQELHNLQDLASQEKCTVTFVGERPSSEEIERAATGAIDARIRDVAVANDALFITSDRVQAYAAAAQGVRHNYLRPIVEEPDLSRLKVSAFFEEGIMSVHLKADCIPMAKRGTPGNLSYEAIGVNGWAVYDQALNISGIWVASVSAGSPAAKAGILSGDIIMALNGLPMALDGTMADYCDVLRTAGEGEPMTVEVLRYDTGQTLRGEINGEAPIEVVSVAAAIEDDTDIDTGGGSETYSAYQSVTDDTGTLIVNVPVEWGDIDPRPCDNNGVDVPCVNAATDINGFYDSYTTSGMFFGLFGPTDLETLLEDYAQGSACSFYGTYEYEDPVFTGLYDIWENCDGQGTYFVNLAAAPEGGAYTVLIQMAIVVGGDWDALDQAFATFNVLQ